jgi:anti-sigma factor RsiW
MSSNRLDDDIDELLPWYVTGTLNETETDALRTRLAAHPDAARLLQSETTLSRQVAGDIAEVDELLARQSESFEQLRERLRETDQRTKGRKLTFVSLRTCAAAAAICVVAAVATTPWFDSNQSAGAFTTLTETTPATDPTVQLAVTANTSTARVQQLIDAVHGDIVSGPSPHNVYLIALPQGSDVVAIEARLRQNAEVTFVATGSD